MTFRRILAVLTGLLAVLVLVAVSAFIWIFTSADGTRFALERVLAASNGALTVGGIAGSFGEEIILTDIRYRDAAQEATIDRLALRLGFAGLLRRMLVVDDLRSSVVRYRALPSPDVARGPTTALSAPVSLPLAIRVDRASVEGVSIARPDGDFALERIILAGAAEGTAAHLQRLEIRLRGFYVSIQGDINWSDGLLIDGLTSWSGELGGATWLGSSSVAGRWPNLTIDQEMLAPFEETASGTLRLNQEPAFDLAVQWPELGEFTVAGGLDADRMLWRAQVAGSDLNPAALVPGWPGRWTVNGNLRATIGDGYRIESDDLRLAGVLGEQQLDLDFDGAYDDTGALEVTRLVAVLGNNRLELSGSAGSMLDFQLGASFDDLSGIASLAARAEIQALSDKAVLATALTGSATASLEISGALDAPLASGSIRVADSQFVELPLEFALDFAAPANGADTISIEQLEARLGATGVSAQGRFGAGLLTAGSGWRDSDAAIELDLTVAAADLGELAALAAREDIQSLIGRDLPLAGLGGRADASLSLGGSARRANLAGTLGLADFSVDRLPQTQASLEFRAGLYDGGDVSLTLDAATDAGTARLSAGGAIRGSAWTGTLDSFAIKEPWLGDWVLEAPVELALAPDRVDLGDACLVHRSSGLCGEWHYGGSADMLRLSARDFDLAVINPLLPDTISLSGPVSFDAMLDMLAGTPSGQLSASSGIVDIAIALSESDQVTTRLNSVAIAAELDAYALDLEATVEGETLGRADIALTTADIRDESARIGGRVDILWPDLSVLSLLSPDVGEVGGTVALEIELAGSARDPELSGSATLSEGRVAVPEWGMLVQRIDAEALSEEGKTVRYSGSGFIEDSEVFLSGVTDLDPAANWPTRLTLTGDNVPVARRPDATVIASPDLEIDIRLPRIDVNGSVFVPEAELSVEELPVQAVTISPDSVVHGQLARAEIRPIEMSALVSVVLGDDVRYTGSNLDVDLSGGLAVEYVSGRSPIAGGNVKLNGSYQAYGQTLNLERGELLFAGPLDNPAIDVLATRSVGATTVGVRLNGTLLAPVPTLFSEPQMSEANALSYLMFGRPLRASDEEESSALQAAAFALGVQQALPAVQRVGESLGLDELSLEATDIDAGSLMAGKYLNPKLYLSYTYGLFNRLGGFLLRYDINDRFSLETRSGSEKAMDLLYSIEKE